MKISFVSIFPKIFWSFLETSLIKKARDKWLLEFEFVNPRDFCDDKHHQIDDDIYGWGAWLLMKAEPLIQAVESCLDFRNISTSSMWQSTSLAWEKFKILFVSPSEKIFNQKIAHSYAEFDHLILVSGRYEWIDYRFVEYFRKKYSAQFDVVSLGQFVTLWWELPAMTMVEAVVRLVPGVIHEEASWQDESYMVDKNMENLEYPQYTRPDDVRGMKVPDVLLSGHHVEIGKWREENGCKRINKK